MLIPFTRAWKTQRNIDLFVDKFIRNKQHESRDFEYFLRGIGNIDDIYNFLSTPYLGNKNTSEIGQTPFQIIVRKLPFDYISVARTVLGPNKRWENLVLSQLPKDKFFLNRPDCISRLNRIFEGLPKVICWGKVNELLMEAIERNCSSSIPALRHALFGDEDADQAKWAKALVEDRYIFTAISEDASCATIEALLNGLTSAQYQDVLLAIDPQDKTDTPLMMGVVLYERPDVLETIARRFEEPSWEKLLTNYQHGGLNLSKRFIGGDIIARPNSSYTLASILKYLSDDCILRVAQANDSLLLREIIYNSKSTSLYCCLLDNIEDEDKKEQARTLIQQLVRDECKRLPFMQESLMVPVFLFESFKAAAGVSQQDNSSHTSPSSLVLSTEGPPIK